MNKLLSISLGAALCGSLCSHAFAHGGRRLEILVVDNQLAVRGYNSTGVDDGGGVQRPYYNALHDHWAFNPAPGVVAASADLPGFDLFTPGDLAGHAVILTLVDAYRWVGPAVSPAPGTVPAFEALGAGQEIFASFGGDVISTDSPGTLVLIPSVSGAGNTDLDVVYDIGDEPMGQIMALEFVLSTDAPGIADSDAVHVLFSPDGANAAEKLHHASLFTEKFLGTRVCAADITKDGALNVDDIDAFVVGFLAGDLATSDCDGNGVCNVDDIDCFVGAFLGGCN
ncbi:MAG: hypothetical protein DHS20C14_04020 [Phycisphaeraceae bacterium]|nr:MAG: hypothetical protein DHS20C14_04020 [Phycisphaeraceae bacterium]